MRSATTARIHRLPITKARINLGAVAKRAHLAGEYFILEKDGIPIAGIMSADELEDYLESRDPKVQRAIAESNADIRAGRTKPARDLLAQSDRENARKRPAHRR